MMYKTIIAPIVGVLVLVIQFIFGVEIPKEIVNEVVITIGNVVAIVFVITGIFTNNKEEKSPDAKKPRLEQNKGK